MNVEELEEALEDILPKGFRLEDRNGQIVIFTGLSEDEDGELVDFVDEDEDDEDDPDFDPDFKPLEDEDDDE
jgi:hypothetical protein